VAAALALKPAIGLNATRGTARIAVSNLVPRYLFLRSFAGATREKKSYPSGKSRCSTGTGSETTPLPNVLAKTSGIFSCGAMSTSRRARTKYVGGRLIGSPLSRGSMCQTTIA